MRVVSREWATDDQRGDPDDEDISGDRHVAPSLEDRPPDVPGRAHTASCGDRRFACKALLLQSAIAGLIASYEGEPQLASMSWPARSPRSLGDGP
jgi:hypothetical protein